MYLAALQSEAGGTKHDSDDENLSENRNKEDEQEDIGGGRRPLRKKGGRFKHGRISKNEVVSADEEEVILASVPKRDDWR